MATAKLIVSLDGEVLREVDITSDRVTIGRRPYNDIVLENAAISGEHAIVANVLNEYLLEDLNSTNGTYVNGQPVKKHFLQNNDNIDLVKYRIQYIDAAHAADMESKWKNPSIGKAQLTVINGSNAGKSMPILQDATTLGRTGVQVAVITRGPKGHAIAHIEGPAPLLNDLPVGGTPQPLFDGDVIELSRTKISFSMI